MPALLRGCSALVLALGLPVQGMAQELTRPAELPPADYAGLQYVDSRGCLFMRAGTPGNEMWLPRVTRDGVPLCGNPPSGNRVPVAGEAAAAPLAVAPPVAEPPVAEPSAPVASRGYYVAVGSFGVAANAEKALARLKAMNYQTARGRIQGNSGTLVTVFAGPFATAAEAATAQYELRGAGFSDAVVTGGP